MCKNQFEKILVHKHIVLCGDNTNALSIVRALGEKKICPVVIMVQEGHLPLVSKSKYVGEIVKTKSMEESLTVLKSFADESCKPFVYTCDDNHQNVLDLHYDELKDKFYFFNAGERGRLSYLMNKETLCNLAEDCGFVIPKGEAVDRGEMPTSLNYPVFSKTITPFSEGWKRDVGIYYSSQELKEAFSKMISKRLLLQEYVVKKNEMEIQGFSINGGEEVYIAFASMNYRFTRTSFGAYRYCFLLKDEELKEKIRKIIREAHYTGVFEIEFLIDNDDRKIFLEVNFRFSNSNYPCTYGGVNLAYLWAKSMLAGHIDASAIHPLTRQFSFMNEIPDFRNSVRKKKISFRHWVKDLRSADCLMLYHKDDKWPAFSYLLSTIISFVKKKI